MQNFGETKSKDEAKQMQPLVLAQIGDSVETLFVRTFVAKNMGLKINKMNKVVSSVVCAGSQFKTFKQIEPLLSEDEQDIASRARNSHIHSKAKNFSVTEYIYATALEAVYGYLYISGNYERLQTLLEPALENIEK